MRSEEKIVAALKARGWHMAAAESCTGGLLAARVVGVSGASEVLDVSFVTYAPAAKTEYLGVSPELIAACDVVSEPVAAQMAAGVAARAKAQVGVGITGYAGPGGGTVTAPAGTVCFGFYVDGAVSSCTVHFGDIGRNTVRRRAATFALRRLAALIWGK